MNKPLLVLDVQDIFGHAKNLDISITIKEAREIFDSIDSLSWDCENDTFWAFLERHIRKFYKKHKESREPLD